MPSQTESKFDFGFYTFGEGRTGKGQALEFTCRQGQADLIRDFLSKNVGKINVPTTGKMNVEHGGYGRYTRYDIVQRKYAGGNGEDGSGGYREILEIRNPPDGKWGIVIHEFFTGHGSVFTEWDTVADARKAFDKHWEFYAQENAENPKLSGFRRRVPCGALCPWFYAVGDQQLIGDYTFPEGLQDDPVYSFGRKFVVADSSGVISIKTCMGTRFVERKRERSINECKTSRYRLVYFDDGSIWDESYSEPWWCGDKSHPPRPAEGNEAWIEDAVMQFKRLLSGTSKEFVINFINGESFVGKLAPAKKHRHCAEGDYYLVVRVEGKKKSLEGWVYGFKPTPKIPNIVEYVVQQYRKTGKGEIQRIEVRRFRPKKGGKKWYGLFAAIPKC